jgi:hypothetical protein
MPVLPVSMVGSELNRVPSSSSEPGTFGSLVAVIGWLGRLAA